MRIIPGKKTPDPQAALAGRGLRQTRARQVILETVGGADTHPTAEWVWQRVRRTLPRVSLGTVYRNLRQLVAAELLVERADVAGSRFDGNTAAHHHFTCVRCRRVFDLAEPVNAAVHRPVAARTGFEVLHHRIEFYGRCADCRSPRKKRRTAAWQARA